MTSSLYHASHRQEEVSQALVLSTIALSVPLPSTLIALTVPSPVPLVMPDEVAVSRSTENPRVITVTWRPFTLVEVRGFIEYIVHLHEVGSVWQTKLEQRVSMDQSNALFTVKNSSIDYEASVGTTAVSGDAVGPD